jgi:hypothetical protein
MSRRDADVTVPAAALATYRARRELLAFGPPVYRTNRSNPAVVLVTPSSPASNHLTEDRDTVGVEEKLKEVGEVLMVASTVLQSNTEEVLLRLYPMVAPAPLENWVMDTTLNDMLVPQMPLMLQMLLMPLMPHFHTTVHFAALRLCGFAASRCTHKHKKKNERQ